MEARSPGPGHGSEFLVWFPVVSHAFAESAEAVMTPGERRAARRLKVVVVDDSQDVAESLAMVLGLWGHEALIAGDGPAALELAMRHQPDVVLSDVGLPGMDGFELARRLRESTGCPRALLVALSGYGQEEDRRRALDAGFDHHLVKPADLNVLAAILDGVAVTPRAPAASTGSARPQPRTG